MRGSLDSGAREGGRKEEMMKLTRAQRKRSNRFYRDFPKCRNHCYFRLNGNPPQRVDWYAYVLHQRYLCSFCEKQWLSDHRKLNPAQQKRADKFDLEFVACLHHPERRTNRYSYVFQRRRACGSCKTNKRKDGSPRPAHVRNISAEKLQRVDGAGGTRVRENAGRAFNRSSLWKGDFQSSWDRRNTILGLK